MEGSPFTIKANTEHGAESDLLLKNYSCIVFFQTIKNIDIIMRVCCQRCLGGVIVGGSSFFVCFLDQSATKLIIFFSFRNKKNPLAFHQSIIWHAIFKILQMEGFYGLLVRAGRRLFFLPYPPPCLAKEVEIFRVFVFCFCILFHAPQVYLCCGGAKSKSHRFRLILPSEVLFGKHGVLPPAPLPPIGPGLYQCRPESQCRGVVKPLVLCRAHQKFRLQEQLSLVEVAQPGTSPAAV